MMTENYSMPMIIRALGRGKKGTRNLTRSESHFVMQSILEKSITEAQLGAFLMLMRVKEETAEEIAGLVDGCHEAINYQPERSIDVCWPAYAGKKKQPSWFILAAKLLAQNGVKILIHGGGQHTEGRQYAEDVCQSLNISCATNLAEAEQRIDDNNICYLPLKCISPVLSDLIDMKHELGLRSPINTVVRHLNPFSAKLTLQGMFHPAYMTLHHESAKLLAQDNNIVMKGDGGEFEVRPDSDTAVAINATHQSKLANLSPVLNQRSIRPVTVEMKPLLGLWNGEITDDYGEAAVIQTAAIVYAQLNNIALTEAQIQIKQWWRVRS